MPTLIVVVILFALFWILMVRPQRRRQMEQSRMIESVEVGDEIVTAGGLYGHVQGVDEDELLVEIAPGTNVRIARRAVAGVVSPDDEDEEEHEELASAAEVEPAAEAAREEKPS